MRNFVSKTINFEFKMMNFAVFFGKLAAGIGLAG